MFVCVCVCWLRGGIIPEESDLKVRLWVVGIGWMMGEVCRMDMSWLVLATRNPLSASRIQFCIDRMIFYDLKGPLHVVTT